MHYFVAIYKNNEQSIKETLSLNSNEEDIISFHFPLSQYTQKEGQRMQTPKNNLGIFKNFSTNWPKNCYKCLDLCMDINQTLDSRNPCQAWRGKDSFDNVSNEGKWWTAYEV